jgi:hypothetical protein
MTMNNAARYASMVHLQTSGVSRRQDEMTKATSAFYGTVNEIKDRHGRMPRGWAALGRHKVVGALMLEKRRKAWDRRCMIDIETNAALV